MDLVIYLGKKVHVCLSDGYYYVGKVLSVDNDSLTLLDKNNRNVTLTKDSISTIKEVFF